MVKMINCAFIIITVQCYDATFDWGLLVFNNRGKSHVLIGHWNNHCILKPYSYMFHHFIFKRSAFFCFYFEALPPFPAWMILLIAHLRTRLASENSPVRTGNALLLKLTEKSERQDGAGFRQLSSLSALVFLTSTSRSEQVSSFCASRQRKRG